MPLTTNNAQHILLFNYIELKTKNKAGLGFYTDKHTIFKIKGAAIQVELGLPFIYLLVVLKNYY